jgi:hypothetical protein
MKLAKLKIQPPKIQVTEEEILADLLYPAPRKVAREGRGKHR